MPRQIEGITNVNLSEGCRFAEAAEMGEGLVYVEIQRFRQEMFDEIDQARKVLERHYKSWFDPRKGIIRLQRSITDRETDEWAWDLVARLWVRAKDVTWREEIDAS